VVKFELGDRNLEQVLELFEQNGFKLMLKEEVGLDDHLLPNSAKMIGNTYYELYDAKANHNSAKHFAESKKKGSAVGRLLTYNCSFQEKQVRSWLNTLLIQSIWLGGERSNKTEKFAWTNGPLQNLEFEGNKKQYSNWMDGEPNNADNDERCAIQLLGESSGWNDIPCGSTLASVVVEYGKVVVVCPKEHHDANQNFQTSIEEVEL